MRCVSKDLCPLILLFFVSHVSAQISITSGDLLNLIGATQTLEQDSSEVEVDLGSPGANQVWDQRDIEFQNVFSVERTFETGSSTPFASDFPTANLVEHITNDLLDGDVYIFYQVQNDQFLSLGEATSLVFQGMDFIQIDQAESLEAPLPLSMGMEWTSFIRDTFEQAGVSIINYDSTENVVDGWGTLRLPNGDFECLRIKSKSYCTSTTTFSGMSVSETDSEISYVWVSKDNFLLSTISYPDAEVENFSKSQFYSRLASSSGSTSLRERNQIVGLSLHIYPNPFIDNLSIQVALDKDMDIRAEILDVNQAHIKTIINQRLSAGDHLLNWEDSGLSNSGMYFLRITSEHGSLIHPVLRLN